ncbi:MAG: nucleoside hydrolase [Clostridia bacterium]|nr:nucleoside hydrolase [Clostridia bacterium]
MTDIERLKKLQVPAGDSIPCVLDTDAYNEIDDQYAIALLVKHERTDLKAIYACPFFNENSSSPEDGMEKSYGEILNLLTLMGREDMKKNVFRGSRGYLPDEKTPVQSGAARHLCDIAMQFTPENPLYVVSIGCITNVASALLMRPEIADRIVVVWLGGHSYSWPDTNEFNMKQDVAAARVVFDSGCPLVQLPCMGVVSAFYTTGPELEYWLKGKNPLCDYLVSHTAGTAEKYAKGKVWSRVIWDVTAAGWLLGERFMRSEIVHAPIPGYDNRYSFDGGRHLMLCVTHINRDALMGELFRVLAPTS